MSRIVTRRSMILSASVGLPALAVGSSLLGRSSAAWGAPAKAGQVGKAGKAHGAVGPKAIAGAHHVQGPLRPLAELVLQKTRHAFTVAAAEPKRSYARGGLAATAAKFVQSQSRARMARAGDRASARLVAKEAEWTAAFGGYAKLKGPELERALPLDEQLQRAFGKIVEKAGVDKTKRKPHDPDDYEAKPRYERLAFHLNSVKCVEDTNEFDSDEIRIGGQLIRPDGVVTQIASHLVHDDFDAGEMRNYDSSACIGLSASAREALEQLGACNGTMSDPWAGRVLASAPLTAPWPGSFGLVLLMVEEDHGGMNELLTELYQRIQDELRQAIADLGEAAGDAVAEYLGEDVGAIVSEIIVWVLTELVSWIVSLFDNVDDPIAGKSWLVTLPNRTREAIDALASGGVDTPGESCGSTIKKLTFEGDGGRYEARLHWRALA